MNHLKVIFLISLVAGSLFPAAAAAGVCEVQAKADCIIVDTSEEFKEYNGMTCRKFEEELKKPEKGIDNFFSYSGIVNAEGFPLIEVEYNWKFCNRNTGAKILLDPTFVKTTLDGIDVGPKPEKIGGFINPGKCRNVHTYRTFLETQQPVTRMISRMQGYLMDGDIPLDGKHGKGKIICKSIKRLNINMTYIGFSGKTVDECKATATAQCFLKKKGEDGQKVSCKDAMEYPGPDDCVTVPVTYEWKICNREDKQIFFDKRMSKYRMRVGNGNWIEGGNMISKLDKNSCKLWTADVSISTCDRRERNIEITVVGDDEVIGSEKCDYYHFSSFKVNDANPSTSPTDFPTISSKPSPSPTISHAPTLSIAPSHEPTSTPSTKPTGTPTSSPSASPSVAPSPIPTSKPSSKPSISPTKSAKPTMKPSIFPSPSPSQVPSVGPSKTNKPSRSIKPSPNPSVSLNPSLSSKPSTKPTESKPCGCLDCTDRILDKMAGAHSCRARISWLQSPEGGSNTEKNACIKVSRNEFPGVCGPQCDPTRCKLFKSDAPTKAPTNAPTETPPCGCKKCTSAILNKDADGYTCGARITFLQSTEGGRKSEINACKQVAGGLEFPSICGPECDPGRCNSL